LSPATLVALLTALLILIGFLAFLFTSRRDVEVTVDVRATPTPTPSPIVVVVSPTPIVVTATPLPTLPPTPTEAPAPKEPTPTPTPPPPKEPAPQTPQPPAAAPAPQPPAPAVPQPPGAAPPPPAAVQPSGEGGFGNTRSDFQASYGAPIGRTPDGLDIYPAERSQVQVAFQNDRVVVLRLVLQDDRVMPLAEARLVAGRFIPDDAQPVASGTVERPVDVFRSAALASLFDPAAFRGAEPGVFSVAYIPSGDGFSGFMIQLGRPA
jgi:hypothetical protein